MTDKRTRIIVTAGLAAGILVAALDQTIVDTAFPRMIADLGVVTIFTWVITAYMLASTAVVPVVGKLADLFGRKIFFLGGLVLFVGGSALCGQAQSMTQLIIFRAIQGLGAGALMPIVLTIIGDLYPGNERAKLQGVFGGIFGLASIIGPKLGGWLTHNLSWRWVFYVNLPVGLVAFLIILLGLKESRGEKRPIDYWGAVTVTTGISALLLALVQGGNEFPWGSWQIVSLFALAAVTLTAFIFIERRVPEPVLNFQLFKNRTYAVMSAVAMLMSVGMFGTIIFVPWFIQGVVGVDPNVAGSVMTPMMFSVVAFSMTAGRIVTRVAYRWVIGAGFLFVATGMFLMTGWSVETTQLQATLVTMVVGAGLGCIMPIMTLAVQNAFPPHFRGQVTSGVSFFRSIGATVGASVFGVVFNNQMSARFAENLGGLFAQAQAQLARVPEAAAALQQLAAKPQGLVQILLQEQARERIPAPLLEPLTLGVKQMMVGSLHTVFWTSVAVVLVGFAVSQLLGNASLTRQLKELEAQGIKETGLQAPAPVLAD